jgi:TolA-binding protein
MGSIRRLFSSKSLLSSFLFFAAWSSFMTTPARAEPNGQATAENLVAGSFDSVTEVPVASALLGILRGQESVPTTPENMVARLDKIEAILRDYGNRLSTLESQVAQLQSEVVKVENVNRIRELQRIAAEIQEIILELKTLPAGEANEAILEFRAQQQADSLKNNAGFDIWMLSDLVETTDPQTNAKTSLIRTEFHSEPAFDIYGMALLTWFAALELKYADRPQQMVEERRPKLREHSAFLRIRDGWHELRGDASSDPVTLREYLDTAEFCRLETSQKFADNQGNCVFSDVCIDRMAHKTSITGSETLVMNPPAANTLCTWNPDQPRNYPGEGELRVSYHSDLMDALAETLDRLATSGSELKQFIGTFPNFIHTAIYSTALDAPLRSPRGVLLGAVPSFPACLVLSCTLSSESADAHWKVSGQFAGTGLVTIANDQNGLCLDVKDSLLKANSDVILWSCNNTSSQQWVRTALTNQTYTLALKSGSLCATIKSGTSGLGRMVLRSTPLVLQPCVGSKEQTFSSVDNNITPPH